MTLTSHFCPMGESITNDFTQKPEDYLKSLRWK
ncbi:metal-sulfur cluster biosynthetic enzyme [Pedobacter sp. UYP30]